MAEPVESGRGDGLAPHATNGSPPGSGALHVTAESQPSGAVVLRVGGELDSVTGSFLIDRITAAATGADVVVDLSRVSFMASAGLRALITGRDRVHDAGMTFRLLYGGSRSVRRALTITGTTQLFDFVDVPPARDPHDDTPERGLRSDDG